MKWLAIAAAAILFLLAAARCSRDVVLGVDPSSVTDGGLDGVGAD